MRKIFGLLWARIGPMSAAETAISTMASNTRFMRIINFLSLFGRKADWKVFSFRCCAVHCATPLPWRPRSLRHDEIGATAVSRLLCAFQIWDRDHRVTCKPTPFEALNILVENN